MKKPSEAWGFVFLSSAALLAAQGSADAQIGGGTTPLVVCDGLTCGGNGGASASPFLYRVDPNGGGSISSLEIPVEDGELANYSGLAAPAGWSWQILTVARAHNELRTPHGTVTGSAGTCPYVLRFFGPSRSTTFELGYSYIGKPGFHESRWKTSNGFQATWSHAVGNGRGPVHSPMRLNVLVIVLDDVGTDKLTMYDDLYANAYDPPPTAGTVTPRLDSLAAQGIRFTNYYTNPLCSTSRSCIMTGRYTVRTGLGWLTEPTVTAGCEDPVPEPGETCYQLLDDEVFLPELLKAGFLSGGGYASGAFGKYHLSYWTPDLTPFPGLESHALDNGFDRFYGTMDNVTAFGGDHYDWWKVEHDVLLGGPDVFLVSDTWNASVAREDALEWINAQTRPFFAYVAFNPPHIPPQVPPVSLLSQATRDLLTVCEQQLGGGGGPCPDPNLVYRAMLEGVDTEIANLLDGIDAAKLANTMIFVVADNGTSHEFIQEPHADNHGKSTVLQLGVRVPLIVSGPLVPPAAEGQRADGLVNVVDFWRTIGSITGADEGLAFQNLEINPCLEPWIDSKSFLSMIEDPLDPGLRTWAFSQLFAPNTAVAHLCDKVVFSPDYACLASNRRAITDGEFKLIRRRITPRCVTPPDYDESFYRIGPETADVAELTDLLDGSDQLVANPPEGAEAALIELRIQMNSLSGD